MVRIDGFEFGLLIISGKKYWHDVLILPDGSVRRRTSFWGKAGGHIIRMDEKLSMEQPGVWIPHEAASGERRSPFGETGIRREGPIPP